MEVWIAPEDGLTDTIAEDGPIFSLRLEVDESAEECLGRALEADRSRSSLDGGLHPAEQASQVNHLAKCPEVASHPDIPLFRSRDDREVHRAIAPGRVEDRLHRDEWFGLGLRTLAR